MAHPEKWDEPLLPALIPAGSSHPSPPADTPPCFQPGQAPLSLGGTHHTWCHPGVPTWALAGPSGCRIPCRRGAGAAALRDVSGRLSSRLLTRRGTRAAACPCGHRVPSTLLLLKLLVDSASQLGYCQRGGRGELGGKKLPLQHAGGSIPCIWRQVGAGAAQVPAAPEKSPAPWAGPAELGFGGGHCALVPRGARVRH